MNSNAPQTVGDVVRDLVHHPYEYFVRKWNWKSALTSALARACIFFVTNLSAGLQAATGALLTELVFRSATSGFYGSVTQAFRRAQPAWAAMTFAMILLPALSHGIEFVVHWLRGTPKLKNSIIASVIFTVISTLFNLYAMRKGILIVGEGEDSQSFSSDMKRLPGVIGSFLALGPLYLWRSLKGESSRS